MAFGVDGRHDQGEAFGNTDRAGSRSEKMAHRALNCATA
jgi:hypothetical protein